MDKEKLLPLSIICLAISLVVSSTIISNGIKEASFHVSNSLNGSMTSIGSSINNISSSANNNTNQTDKDLMTLSEAGNYLGTSANNLFYSIENKTITVPYTKIEGNYIFSKKAIDKWIETQMKQ